MKTFLLSLVFVAGFALSGMSQSLASQLQSNTWHVRGKLDGSKLILSTKPDAAEWDAKFSASGTLSYCYTTKSSIVDATGVEVPANTYYCDDFNYYEVKHEVVLIKHTDKSYYYKVKALSDKSGYELNPATSADFK